MSKLEFDAGYTKLLVVAKGVLPIIVANGPADPLGVAAASLLLSITLLSVRGVHSITFLASINLFCYSHCSLVRHGGGWSFSFLQFQHPNIQHTASQKLFFLIFIRMHTTAKKSM